MKRALFMLLTLPLAVVFACGPAKNNNSNVNINANASSNTNQGVAPAVEKTDKTVQIFISDGSPLGTYIIEQPCPVTIHKAKNQKIVWCIVYDGAFTPPTNVIIDEFRSPPPPALPDGSGAVDARIALSRCVPIYARTHASRSFCHQSDSLDPGSVPS